MKTSLNPAKLSADNLSLTEFIDLASRHGFDGVDFGIGAAQNAALSLGGPSVLADYFKEKKVAPAVFGLDVEWRKDNVSFEQGISQLPEKAILAEQIGCTRCVTYILPAVNQPYADWERETARRFGEIARILGDVGIRFGLEWVGPHHLRVGGANATGTVAGISTMEQTLALIDRIGLSSVGLLVDSYHCYTTGIGEAEIAGLSDSLIVHAHINDAKLGVGFDKVLDGDRVLPGEGEIDLTGFLRGLRSAGYTGYVATEVLSPHNIANDYETAAGKVRQSLRTIGL
jgi:sugar phosphate isomerase/epimerase